MPPIRLTALLLGALAPGLAVAPAHARTPRQLPSAGPLPIVYDLLPVATAVYRGGRGVPGLRTMPRSLRQFPVGEPFPPVRQASKVSHRELAGRSPRQIAALIRARLRTTSLGTPVASGFVTIDEIGRELRDGGLGPELLGAMRILSRRRHAPTGEALSRRVLFYGSPLLVGNVGARNDIRTWDAVRAATRLAGGIYLQMYHARAGAIMGVATSSEWRVYLPRWRAWLGRRAATRLRVVMTGGFVGQATQWRWARQTRAGRAALRAGAGVYRLGSRAEAIAWLRQFNRHARPR